LEIAQRGRLVFRSEPSVFWNLSSAKRRTIRAGQKNF
jgi:hypothetical protein